MITCEYVGIQRSLGNNIVNDYINNDENIPEIGKMSNTVDSNEADL